MAELEEKAKQPCAEATENKADSYITPHPKKEKEVNMEQNGQGEGEHTVCFKDQSLKDEKADEQYQNISGTLVEKNHEKEEQTLEPEGKKSELVENDIKEGEVTIELVEKNASQGEKNDNPEDKNMKEDGMIAESEKEKSHADEGNQSQGEGEHRECFKEPCLNKPKEPEEKNKEADGMIEKELEKEKKQADEEKTREPRQQSSKVERKEEPEEKETSQDETDNEQAENPEAVKRSSETNSLRSQKSTLKTREKIPFKQAKIKYIAIETGKTLNSHKEFLTRLHKKKSRLKKVDKAEECKFIQVFCPVTSRAGTDIEAALHQLNKISETKPAVLVVLHCTNDPECVVPDSSRYVTRENMIVVDCLFNEDKGLYKCSKNKIAVDKVTKWLKKKPWRNVK